MDGSFNVHFFPFFSEKVCDTIYLFAISNFSSIDIFCDAISSERYTSEEHNKYKQQQKRVPFASLQLHVFIICMYIS